MRLDLRAPLIFMVLAATAIPVEWRPPGALGFSIQPIDVLLNVAGYLPVGILLSPWSLWRAMLAVAAMTVFAESSQLVMVHRDPSIVDVVANLSGGALGFALGRLWKGAPTAVMVGRWTSLASGAAAAALIASVWMTSGSRLNARGASEAGRLEAHWTFDEREGSVSDDASGHGLRGTLRHQPLRVAGRRGGALAFDGARSYVDFDRPEALRLAGDLTVSAWIKSAAYPVDDAAIVSTMRHIGGAPGDTGYGVGFQLDTTIDTGPRTIGFKFTNGCGALVARYGRTALTLDTWYHVAGVYDAKARSSDVYLNGKLDSGELRGTVQGARRSSREALYVGRRSDLGGFEFAGAIDDVRIYSRALTPEEIAADMGGGRDGGSLPPAMSVGNGTTQGTPGEDALGCSWSSELEDSRMPGAAAAVGVLVTIACLGLLPGAGAAFGLLASAVAGFVLVQVASPTLPPMNLWLFPVTAVGGGAAVVFSRRRLRPGAGAADTMEA